jgi:hypothetical protein
MTNIRTEAFRRAIMVDYHNKGFGSPIIKLANMKCHLIENGHEAVVGDFVYHYSSQLDAFTLCEVMEVEVTSFRESATVAATDLKCIVIDSDSPSQIGDTKTHRVGSDGKIWAYLIYRADAVERQEMEANGGTWEGDLDYISVMSGRTDATRRLRNRLYYMPLPSVTSMKETLSWFKRLFGSKS